MADTRFLIPRYFCYKTGMDTNSTRTNPLLTRATAIPFDTVTPQDAVPAITALIQQTEEELTSIKSVQGARTFENTIVPLDDLGVTLDYAVGVVAHIENVATTPEWREAYNQILPLISEFKSKILFDPELWTALKSYAETDNARSLSGAKARYLKKTLDSFRRNGADLPADKKDELAKISTELSRITNLFSQNTLDATNLFECIITDEKELAGLPPSALAMGRASAQAKGIEGWRFTLQAPSYIAIMTYLDSRSRREEFYRAFNTRCTSGPHQNVLNIHTILDLRAKKAAMLGFADFADLVLEERMAGTGKAALAFVENLRQRITPHFTREQEDLTQFVRETFGESVLPLKPWDLAYYAEKMRLARYDFDEEALRPYFPLPNVMEGLFSLVRSIFGVSVSQTQGVPVWDPSVTTYSAFDVKSGALLGHFYADFSPRENKRSGAWMDNFNVGVIDGRDPYPHVGLIAGNFTPASDGKPALLSHDEVNTLFHEFGHLLHLLCSKVELRNQSMSGVAWDFIELPSQIMENWCWEREALDMFAAHFESGEKIPHDLFEKLMNAKNFRSASALMRQLGFSTMDLMLHVEYKKDVHGDLLDYARKILQRHSSLPLPDYASIVTTFTHLFSSPVAYACGYYSYQWAEVLDADAFSRFKKDGIMCEATGRHFRDTVLSLGDTKPPQDLFKEFMGREPQVTSLLERAGLLA